MDIRQTLFTDEFDLFKPGLAKITIDDLERAVPILRKSSHKNIETCLKGLALERFAESKGLILNQHKFDHTDPKTFAFDAKDELERTYEIKNIVERDGWKYISYHDDTFQTYFKFRNYVDFFLGGIAKPLKDNPFEFYCKFIVISTTDTWFGHRVKSKFMKNGSYFNHFKADTASFILED